MEPPGRSARIASDASDRSTIFRPALVASIVNGVALVASIGVLVWHVVSRPPRWVWWVLVVLSSSRPLF
jgi:hypothetical protein